MVNPMYTIIIQPNAQTRACMDDAPPWRVAIGARTGHPGLPGPVRQSPKATYCPI